MNISSSNERPSSPPPKRRKNRFNLFNLFGTGEYNASASEAGNLLLVIATLIATVTFQIGVNPPGGVWQDTKDGHEAGTAIYAPLPREEVIKQTKEGQEAGIVIYATLPIEVNVTTNVTTIVTTNVTKFEQTPSSNLTVALQSNLRRAISYFVFLGCNTLALSTSVVVMLCLTRKFPFIFFIRIAIALMLGTYGSSIYIITPDAYTQETLFVLLGFFPVGWWFLYFLYDK